MKSSGDTAVRQKLLLSYNHQTCNLNEFLSSKATPWEMLVAPWSGVDRSSSGIMANSIEKSSHQSAQLALRGPGEACSMRHKLLETIQLAHSSSDASGKG